MAKRDDVNFTGIWLSPKLLASTEVRGHQMILLAHIEALSHNDRFCYASNDWFADKYSLSKSTVSEAIKALHEKGLICIVEGKGPDGRSERQMFVSPDGAAHMGVDSPLGEVGTVAGSENRTAPQAVRKTELASSENRTINQRENKYISLAGAREAAVDLHGQIIEAAGEALDLNRQPGMTVTRDLVYLLQDLPTSPACTVDEILDAVRWVAAYMLRNHGAGSLKSWGFTCTKAREYRDARINGKPVRPVEARASPAGDFGDVKAWDLGRWRAAFRAAGKLGGWQAEWGPEPGEDGSFVPAELVGEWLQGKGVAA